MTTPAKKPFDAESHRWGMAYKFGEQTVIIIQVKDFGWFTYLDMDTGLFGSGEYTSNDFTRAPEHDLIPRKDVDALIEALENIKITASMASGNGAEEFCQWAHCTSEKALSEF